MPWRVPWVPRSSVGEELPNVSCSPTGLCPYGLQLLYWIFSFRSSPVLILWNPQMILATSGLVLIVPSDLPAPPVSCRCPALAQSQDETPSTGLPGYFYPGQRHAPCYRNRDEMVVGPQDLSLGRCTIAPLHICALDKDKHGHLLLTTEHYREPPARHPDGPAASQCHSEV